MWVVLAPAAYLLGTFPSATLVASASGVDISATGSGNPGASNVTRALGWRKGALVFVLDALKGVLATLAGLWLGGRAGGYVFGAAAILGHIFPLTRRLRGGKGVATGAGVIAVLQPVVAAVVAAIWLVVSRVTGKAAVASITAVVAAADRPRRDGRAGMGDRGDGRVVRAARGAPHEQHPAPATPRGARARADAGQGGAVRLLDPLALGSVVAPNRVMFGPHVTNLGDDERRISVRHVAYYRRRAAGGCGLVVTEGASVHESDWPYERAPDAARCADGWGAVAAAVHEHGTLAIASLDHAGGQGSSAYSQRELWAPSRVPEVTTREVPKWMEDDDIAAVVAGFGAAARIAVDAGCDGVEINAGQHSLVRQFLSGLTNNRIDRWGVAGPASTGRTQFAHDVIAAARAAIGDARVLGLRLSCDELAPWAGITPDAALAIAAELTAEAVDYLVVTRGSIFSAEQTRPDFHQPPAFNRELARVVAAAVTVPVFAQGSIVDVDDAEWMVDPDGGGCAGVEMTRAQIAEPDLVAKLRRGAARPHPAVHALQPDVSGTRRPQPDRDVRRGADVGARDGGSRLVRGGRNAAPGGDRRRRRRRARVGACRRRPRPHGAARGRVGPPRRHGCRRRAARCAGALARVVGAGRAACVGRPRQRGGRCRHARCRRGGAVHGRPARRRRVRARRGRPRARRVHRHRNAPPRRCHPARRW